METTPVMDANTVTLIQTIAIFGALFGFWWKLDGKINAMDSKLDGKIQSLDTKLSGEIKEVRLASENAHKEIISRLGEIEKVQATHTERFNTVDTRINCVDDKVDGIQRRLDDSR